MTAFQSPRERKAKGTAFDEMQLSLREAHRLTILDAIQAHDAELARSLADLPDEEWDKTGDKMKKPFESSYETDVDEDEMFLQIMFYDDDGSDTKVITKEDFKRNSEESLTPLTIREGKTPMNSTGSRGKEEVDEGDSPITGKGKEKVDEGDIPVMSSTRKGKRKVDDSPSFSSDTDISELEVVTSESDWETICQICFDSEQTTSTFVTLEGMLPELSFQQY